MAKFTPTERVLPHELLDRFRLEIAAQEGLTGPIVQSSWTAMTSRECGRTGGRIGRRMVKVMIKQAEKALSDGDTPTL